MQDWEGPQRSAVLSGTSHGGTTVRIESTDPSIAQVAANAGEAGSDFVDVFVPDGTTNARFHVLGFFTGVVTGTTPASVEITASATGVTSDSDFADVRRLGLHMSNLGSTQNALHQ